MFSLPAGSGKLAQRFDVTPKFRSEGVDFGAETKIFRVVSRSAGKIALVGVHARTHLRRAAARPPTTGNTNAPTIMNGAKGAAVLAAVITLATAGDALAGTTTIQRSMSTTSGAGASCSQANDCGSCSITCPTGKAAICQSATDQPSDDRGRQRCPPPACFCQ